MTSFDSCVLSYLLNSLWQAPLLLLLGWVAARLVRRIGAEAEHRVWVGTLILQAILPAFSSLPLAWVRELSLWRGHEAGPGIARVTVEAGPGVGLSGWQPGAGLLALAAIAYAVVTAFFVARFAWRCAQLIAIRRNATELQPTGNTALAWSQALTKLGIDEVTLATSSRISAPVTMGIWRRLILLPEAIADSLAESEFRAAIEHELAHVVRNDFAKNLAYELLALPISYHPVLRITRARITETREMVCDEVAAGTNGAMEYGRSLLRLAAQLVAGPGATPHAIGIFDGNTLERRLMRLKNREVGVKGGRRIVMLLACAVLAVATCASAVALHLNVDAAAAQNAKTNPKVVHVSAGVMQGNILTKVMPKYPQEAKDRHIQGTVRLDATIGKDGAVQDLKVISGPKELRQSALDAVNQWKYKPYLLNGNPVEVQTTINVIYSLANKSPEKNPPPPPDTN